ncbi:lipid II:glycine glycyltransferase FemX [Roseibium sp.]|uniref:lipid II:glycine glycyltransferase FemX n=1 Tax=Roseibium sp. TaxID=1936156 RepID=UPI003B514DD4
MNVAPDLKTTAGMNEAAMRALEPRYVSPADWDALAVQFCDVIHEQTECFNALRWQPSQLERIAFFRDDVLVSGAVVLLVHFPFMNTGVAVIKWGPLWRRRGAAVDRSILGETISALKTIYAEERSFFLSFFPRADAEVSEIEEQALREAGFYQGEDLDSPERYFVNVGISLGDIRSSLSQKWRYNLKKAEKRGLTARIVEGPAGAREFMSLYQEMMDRKNFHDTSAIDTLGELMVADEAALRPLVVFIDDACGEPVASAVVDVSGERAVYLYGATRDKALPLNAGYMMHWEIVRRLQADPNNRWYDLGGADADSRLHQFKRGFVGKAGVISTTPSYYHFANKTHIRFLGELLYFARRMKGRILRRLHEVMGGKKN